MVWLCLICLLIRGCSEKFKLPIYISVQNFQGSLKTDFQILLWRACKYVYLKTQNLMCKFTIAEYEIWNNHVNVR